MKRFLRLLFIWREARMLFNPGRASKVRSSARLAILVTTTCAIWTPITACAQRLPTYLADRGTGIATSMFGEYVRSGELLVYPFYEYTSQNLEYKPSELGFGLDQDFRGKFREHEALIFLAYGLSERLALEFESVFYTTASLRKDPSDPSAVPAELRES